MWLLFFLEATRTSLSQRDITLIVAGWFLGCGEDNSLIVHNDNLLFVLPTVVLTTYDLLLETNKPFVVAKSPSRGYFTTLSKEKGRHRCHCPKGQSTHCRPRWIELATPPFLSKWTTDYLWLLFFLEATRTLLSQRDITLIVAGWFLVWWGGQLRNCRHDSRTFVLPTVWSGDTRCVVVLPHSNHCRLCVTSPARTREPCPKARSSPESRRLPGTCATTSGWR